MSIKFKLTLIIVAILLIDGLAMGAFIYWQNNRVITAHLNSDITNTVDQVTQLVNFYVDRAENNLTSLANDPLIIEALETKDPVILAQVTKKITDVNETITTIENIGLDEIKGSTCILVGGDQASAPFIGKDFSSRDYCQGVVKTKATYLSSAYLSAISNNPVLGLAVPVKNIRGEVIGNIIGTIDLSELRGYLWDLQQGQASKVELLDRHGLMFLNTEEKITSISSSTDHEEIELKKIAIGLAGNNNQGSFRDSDNFVGYKFNGSVTVVYEKSARTLLSLVQTMNLTLILAIVTAIILTIIIVFLFVSRITTRITRLSKITQEIAGGKFNIKLSEAELKATDETAVLARSFNDMAGKLDDLYKNLDKKVKEKTKKLELSENSLKKNLIDSEKLNKLMVGRELEMIRLKQEIAALKKNTGDIKSK